VAAWGEPARPGIGVKIREAAKTGVFHG